MLLRTMAGYDDRAPLSLHGDPDRRPVLPVGRVAWFGDLGLTALAAAGERQTADWQRTLPSLLG